MSLRDKYTDEEWDALEAKLALDPPFARRKEIPVEKYERVEILSDGDGHEYVVPHKLNLIRKFYNLLEDEEDDYEEFNKIFEQYRCSGDPFVEYEFYIKKK